MYVSGDAIFFSLAGLFGCCCFFVGVRGERWWWSLCLVVVVFLWE